MVRSSFAGIFVLIPIIIASGCQNPFQSNPTLQASGINNYKTEVVYITPDGWKIHADFYPSIKKDRPLLLVIHMLMSNRSYYPVTIDMLKSCNVLKIDMRGHGDSVQYRGKKTGWRSGKGNVYYGSFIDIEMGIIEVNDNFGDYVDIDNIFLQGSSYSCVLVLQYFKKNPKGIRGIIFMSPGDSYGQDIVANYRDMIIGKSRVPVFYVCSRKDRYCFSKTIAMEKLSRLYALTDNIFIYENAHVHGTHFFYTHKDKYPSKIIEWMEQVTGAR